MDSSVRSPRRGKSLFFRPDLASEEPPRAGAVKAEALASPEGLALTGASTVARFRN
jgi:hypothetical protein